MVVRYVMIHLISIWQMVVRYVLVNTGRGITKFISPYQVSSEFKHMDTETGSIFVLKTIPIPYVE